MINTAKQLMLEGKPAIGAEAGLGSIIAVETLASIGWDYIMVDNQHGNWSDHMNLDAFRSKKLGGSIPISRVRHNEYSFPFVRRANATLSSRWKHVPDNIVPALGQVPENFCKCPSRVC